MNKKLILLVGVAGLIGGLVIALVGVGIVVAQTPTPPTPFGGGYGMMSGGWGMMGGGTGQGMMGGGFGRGMMGGRQGATDGWGMMGGGNYGPMHDAMLNALAKGLDLTREELDQRLAAGETPFQIAESLGLSQTDFAKILTEARQAALKEAVTQGYLTQEQADQMLNHMNSFGGLCPHLTPSTPTS